MRLVRRGTPGCALLAGASTFGPSRAALAHVPLWRPRSSKPSSPLNGAESVAPHATPPCRTNRASGGLALQLRCAGSRGLFDLWAEPALPFKLGAQVVELRHVPAWQIGLTWKPAYCGNSSACMARTEAGERSPQNTSKRKLSPIGVASSLGARGKASDMDGPGGQRAGKQWLISSSNCLRMNAAARPLAWLLHHPTDQYTCWTRTFG